MARKLVECDHCGGKKNCMKSGGKSCKACLKAAGQMGNQWGVVRCSYCGGTGHVWIELEEEKEEEKEKKTSEQ